MPSCGRSAGLAMIWFANLDRCGLSYVVTIHRSHPADTNRLSTMYSRLRPGSCWRDAMFSGELANVGTGERCQAFYLGGSDARLESGHDCADYSLPGRLMGRLSASVALRGGDKISPDVGHEKYGTAFVLRYPAAYRYSIAQQIVVTGLGRLS